MINERSVGGDGKHGTPDHGIELDALFRDGDRIAADLELLRIESLRHQELIANEEDPAVVVRGARRDTNHRLPHRLVRGAADADGVRRFVGSTEVRTGEKEEVFSIREEPRPAMGDVVLRFIERGGFRQSTASR